MPNPLTRVSSAQRDGLGEFPRNMTSKDKPRSLKSEGGLVPDKATGPLACASVENLGTRSRLPRYALLPQPDRVAGFHAANALVDLAQGTTNKFLLLRARINARVASYFVARAEGCGTVISLPLAILKDGRSAHLGLPPLSPPRCCCAALMLMMGPTGEYLSSPQRGIELNYHA